MARVAYDRSTARKPGQLTWGSGTTPVFFGPDAASNYVAITDNARPHEHLLVYALPTVRGVKAALRQVCSVPVLTKYAESGTEDAPIGYDRTVIVNNTYGYSYPAGTTGTSQPASAEFQGGMTRVDVNAAGTGCSTVWDSTARSAALPRLSIADGLIHTVVVSTPATPARPTSTSTRTPTPRSTSAPGRRCPRPRSAPARPMTSCSSSAPRRAPA